MEQKTKVETTIISIYTTKKVRDAAERLAKAQRRSLSQWGAILIERETEKMTVPVDPEPPATNDAGGWVWSQ